MRDDDFFVGYLQTPDRLGRRLRRQALLLAIAVVALAAVVAMLQRPLFSGVFEFGTQREFEGVLYERPLPVLRVSTPERRESAANLLLVGFGKAGLPEFARGHHGKRVRFAGSLIYRERMTMVEMNDAESFEVIGEPEPWQQRRRFETVGPLAVTGELVDTKCFFGVMRPATGKVHRACAIRCLSGGVPPGLLLRDAAGDSVVLMLAGPRGEALDLDVQWAARSVHATGVLELHDGVPVLRADELELVSEDRLEEAS